MTSDEKFALQAVLGVYYYPRRTAVVLGTRIPGGIQKNLLVDPRMV